MVRVDRLPQGQRLVLAELSGLAGRYGTGTQRDVDHGQAVAGLRAVTTDPVLLGIAADMEVAAAHAAEVRARLESRGIRYELRQAEPGQQ